MKVFFLGLLLLSLSCALKKSSQKNHSWINENKERIQDYLSSNHKIRPTIAVFDWDNTVIKNDIGDATMWWLLRNDHLLRPRSWKATSPWLGSQAIKALNKYCTNVPVGTSLITSKNLACTDTILNLYSEGQGWKNTYNKDWIDPAYAWLASLLAGRTHGEIKKIARTVISEALTAPIAQTQMVGVKSYPAYLRVYPEMKELIQDLKNHQIDVWIVSASPQPIVEVFAEEVGISVSRVVGIRNMRLANGKYLPNLEGCGTIAHGKQEMITFRQGKRCWINKEIFQLKDPIEQMQTRSPISFAAGDSDTDVFFLKDALDLRLVINRNKTELMCHAWVNKDGKWLVNPMFIEPKPKRDIPYDCSAYGYSNQIDKY